MDSYRRYGPAVLRKCERILASREEAEDVVQTLFLDLYRPGRADVGLPYLFRAATNRCLNRLRDAGRRQALLARHGPTVLGGEVPPIDGRYLHQVLLTEGLARNKGARISLAGQKARDHASALQALEDRARLERRGVWATHSAARRVTKARS